jgi:hypothetical protein
MRILIPFLFLVLLSPGGAAAAWEDSPDCPARMGVTRSATRDFYRLFATPGASPERILELLDRAQKTIGPSKLACASPDEQVSLDFQLLELHLLGREIRQTQRKSSIELAPVAARDG